MLSEKEIDQIAQLVLQELAGAPPERPVGAPEMETAPVMEDWRSPGSRAVPLLDHPEEARRMGENGRRAVEEEFNWGTQEKKLLALYEEILK